MDDDVAALSQHLNYLGLAEEKAGYGHATGDQVAEAALAWVRARYTLTPRAGWPTHQPIQRGGATENPMIAAPGDVWGNAR